MGAKLFVVPACYEESYALTVIDIDSNLDDLVNDMT